MPKLFGCGKPHKHEQRNLKFRTLSLFSLALTNAALGKFN